MSLNIIKRHLKAGHTHHHCGSCLPKSHKLAHTHFELSAKHFKAGHDLAKINGISHHEYKKLHRAIKEQVHAGIIKHATELHTPKKVVRRKAK